MHGPHDLPPRIPQRVVVAGTPGPALDGFLQRVAGTLDVPLVRATELAGPDDVARLAAFDGWVTTGEYDAARPTLLERAEAVVLLDLAAPVTLGSLVRRTLRRSRGEAAPDHGWIADLELTGGGPGVVRLTQPEQVERWLRSLDR